MVQRRTGCLDIFFHITWISGIWLLCLTAYLLVRFNAPTPENYTKLWIFAGVCSLATISPLLFTLGQNGSRRWGVLNKHQRITVTALICAVIDWLTFMGIVGGYITGWDILLAVIVMGIATLGAYLFIQQIKATPDKEPMGNLQRIGNTELMMHPDPEVEAKIQALWDRHMPGMGAISYWFRNKAMKGENQYLAQANEQMSLLFRQANALAAQVVHQQQQQYEWDKWMQEHKRSMAILQMELSLILAAGKKGLTVNAHERQLMMQFEADLQAETERKKSELRLDELRAKNKIETDNQRKKKKIELDARWQEIQQNSDAADLEAIAPALVAKKLRDEIVAARRERYAIEINDDPEDLKEDILSYYDDFIANIQGQIDATKTGPVQKQNRKNT